MKLNIFGNDLEFILIFGYLISLKKGCISISNAVILFLGLNTRIFSNKLTRWSTWSPLNLLSIGNFGISGIFKSRIGDFIFLRSSDVGVPKSFIISAIVSTVFKPLNNYELKKHSAITQPIDQISTDLS